MNEVAQFVGAPSATHIAETMTLDQIRLHLYWKTRARVRDLRIEERLLKNAVRAGFHGDG